MAGGGGGAAEVLSPPCAALSFADGIAGREQVRLPLRFHPTLLLLLLLSPTRQRKLFQERKRRRNFCPGICKYLLSRAVKDKAFVPQLQLLHLANRVLMQRRLLFPASTVRMKSHSSSQQGWTRFRDYSTIRC